MIGMIALALAASSPQLPPDAPTLRLTLAYTLGRCAVWLNSYELAQREAMIAEQIEPIRAAYREGRASREGIRYDVCETAFDEIINALDDARRRDAIRNSAR